VTESGGHGIRTSKEHSGRVPLGVAIFVDIVGALTAGFFLHNTGSSARHAIIMGVWLGIAAFSIYLLDGRGYNLLQPRKAESAKQRLSKVALAVIIAITGGLFLLQPII
jgi:Kef-type K+ transport system membrane component KefB